MLNKLWWWSWWWLFRSTLPHTHAHRVILTFINSFLFLSHFFFCLTRTIKHGIITLLSLITFFAMWIPVCKDRDNMRAILIMDYVSVETKLLFCWIWKQKVIQRDWSKCNHTFKPFSLIHHIFHEISFGKLLLVVWWTNAGRN